MRYLSELISPDHINDVTAELWQEIPIMGVTANSADVHPGMMFVAITGAKQDGRRFVPDAVKHGAAVIVVESLPEGMEHPAVPVVFVENARHVLSVAAARFYGMQPAHMVAVTGTDGKTSTAHFFQQFWHRLGQKAASIGTLGVVGEALEGEHPAINTTPDPVLLHRTLAQMARQGIQYVAMEASSHGLDQRRLDGVRLLAAGFTNLTRDHLDYHGTEEAYFDAKARLFKDVLPGGATAVLNADDVHTPKLEAICHHAGHHVLRFGAKAEGGLHLVSLRPQPDGQQLELNLLGKRYTVTIPLIGGFQAMNLLCAMGLAHACGAEWDALVEDLPHMQGVPGRMQQAAVLKNGAAVYVDYAHTPAGLESVLSHIRPHVAGRLVVVFGCGGDRDRGKRPQMGRIACELADVAIVTDDNPRTENPALIRRDVLDGCEGAREIGGRQDAIRAAVQELREGDVLLIAGKGHERMQIIGTETFPFDDVWEAKMAVEMLETASNKQERL